MVLGIIGAASGKKSDTTSTNNTASNHPATSTSGGKSSSGGKAPASSSAPQAREYDLTATAAGLVEAYSSNQLAADEKYKGKTIKVTGIADSIKNDMFNSSRYNLEIGTGSEIEFTVTCNNMDRGLLNQITVGHQVKVIGLLTDGTSVGVNMNDCGLA